MGKVVGFYSKGKGRKRKVHPITESGGTRVPKGMTVRDQYRHAIKQTTQRSLNSFAKPKSRRYEVEVCTPSPSSLKNIESLRPDGLTDGQLIKRFGELKATKRDYVRGQLSNEYYVKVADPGGVEGKVPKDVFLFTNLDPTIKDFQKEIKKRNLEHRYNIIIEQPKPSKRKFYQKDEWVYLSPATSGSKPYRVVEDKGGFVKLAQWNFAMGRDNTMEVPRHMIKGKAKPPEPHMGGAVSYNKATGWMRISFPEKPPEYVRSGMKSQGFRYQPRSKTWSAKWNPERQDFAEALVGKMQKVDIKPNWAKKAENAAVLAQKHEGQSNEAYDRAHKKLSAIPFGQPILVGHHSEKRHRSDLRKINRLEKKGREESDIAEKYQRRAERYGRKATGEDPVTIHNRIKRLEADERKLRDRKDEHGKRWLAHTKERLRLEREKYKASGGIATEKIAIKPGDRVKTRFGKGTVATISKNTLRVKLDPDPISGRERWIYADSKGNSKLDKTDIYGKVE